jgi:hypothetical protein
MDNGHRSAFRFCAFLAGSPRETGWWGKKIQDYIALSIAYKKVATKKAPFKALSFLTRGYDPVQVNAF